MTTKQTTPHRSESSRNKDDQPSNSTINHPGIQYSEATISVQSMRNQPSVTSGNSIMPAIVYQINQQMGLHACMHVTNTHEYKVLQQIIHPSISQSDACAISKGEVETITTSTSHGSEQKRNKDDQKYSNQYDKHKIGALNKEVQAINNGHNILPAIKYQHGQQLCMH